MSRKLASRNPAMLLCCAKGRGHAAHLADRHSKRVDHKQLSEPPRAFSCSCTGPRRQGRTTHQPSTSSILITPFTPKGFGGRGLNPHRSLHPLIAFAFRANDKRAKVTAISLRGTAWPNWMTRRQGPALSRMSQTYCCPMSNLSRLP